MKCIRKCMYIKSNACILVIYPSQIHKLLSILNIDERNDCVSQRNDYQSNAFRIERLFQTMYGILYSFISIETSIQATKLYLQKSITQNEMEKLLVSYFVLLTCRPQYKPSLWRSLTVCRKAFICHYPSCVFMLVDVIPEFLL